MDKFNFDKLIKKLAEEKRKILVLAANEAQNYFLSSFKNQGFDGSQWSEVQRRKEGTKAYKYPKKKGLQRRTSPILVGAGYKTRGGTLRRAVSNMSRTAKFGIDNIRMIVDLPYAKIHNEGGKAGRGHKSNIPKRQFVGQTNELTKKQNEIIKKELDKIWQE